MAASPSRITRLLLVVALLGAIVPSFVLTRLARAQEATPAATSAEPAGDLAAAAVVPADAFAYIDLTLNPGSDQATLSVELLERLGLGSLVDEATTSILSGDLPVSAGDLLTLLNGNAAYVLTSDFFTNLTGTTVAAADFDTTTIEDEATPVDPDDVSAAPDEAPLGIAIVLSPSDPAAALDRIVKLLTDEAQNRGATIDETEIDGVTVTTVPSSYEYAQDGFAVAQLGDQVVLTPTVADIEPLIAVSTGDAPALGDDEAFTRARTELPGDFLLYGYFNGPAATDAITQILTDPALGMAEMGVSLQAEQLAGMSAYTAFMVRAEDAGFRFESIAFPAAGADPLPMPDNYDVTLDQRLPEDTLLFVDGMDFGNTLGMSMDAAALAFAQYAMSDPSSPLTIPPDATEDEQLAAVYDLVGRILGFHPRTGLTDQLVGEWAFGLAASSIENPRGISALFTSGVENEALLTDSTTKLAAYINALALFLGLGFSGNFDEGSQFTLDDIGGTHVEEVNGALTQVVEIPVPIATDSAGNTETTTLTLQWGIVDGQFLFGFNDGFADAVDASSGSTLADNPRYQAALAELPQEHNGVVFIDLNQIYTLVEPYAEEIFGVRVDDTDAAPIGATPAAGDDVVPNIAALESFAAVSYSRGDVQGVSALLTISEP